MSTDLDPLARRGYMLLPGLVDQAQLDAFERDVAAIAESRLAELGLAPSGREPMIDVFAAGGSYRSTLYKMLPNLASVQAMNHQVSRWCRDSGILERLGFVATAIWCGLRVDLPGEDTYLLPFHQDYASTRCTRALRVWCPLRRVDRHHGSMEVVPESHRLGFLPHDVDDAAYPFVDDSLFARETAELLELEPGTGVLFDPLLLHRSVPNRSQRIKFPLLVQIQDLATLVDPDDQDNEIARFSRMTEERRRGREASLSRSRGTARTPGS